MKARRKNPETGMEYLYKFKKSSEYSVWMAAVISRNFTAELDLKPTQSVAIELLYYGSFRNIPSTVKKAIEMPETEFFAECIAIQLLCPFKIEDVVIYKESPINDNNVQHKNSFFG